MAELKYQNNEELALQYQNGDDYAFTELFEINQGLIRETVNKYQHVKIVDEDTKVSACYKGFMNAAKSFNPEDKSKFSSYCMKIMEREIFKELTYMKQRGREDLVKSSESVNRMVQGKEGETEAIYFVDARIEDDHFEGEFMTTHSVTQDAIDFAMYKSTAPFKGYIIPIICEEYTQSEVAEMYNCARQIVEYQVRQFKKRMKDYMNIKDVHSVVEALN